MGLFDFFKKKETEDSIDPLMDLVLSKIKTGYLVDYDLKTYRVARKNRYDWRDGYFSDEWELEGEDGALFLSKDEEDGEILWTLSKKVTNSKIDSSVFDHIKEHEDPPDEITFDNLKYHLEESSAGHFIRGGSGRSEEFISWDFEDEAGEYILIIEQWDEDEFEVLAGKYVEEYEFSNILPSS